MKYLGYACVAIIGFAVISKIINQQTDDCLVVYCSHDSLYSEKILNDFSKKSGIKIIVKFDTEATKSLGLLELIIKEKKKPRCDLFWNNELLGTMQLKKQGLLLPYKGAGYQRIPSKYRDPDGYWLGFAGRMRVFIINTNHIYANENKINQILTQQKFETIAMAKPMYGTTLTHYCLLWKLWGEKGLKTWHKNSRKRGLRVVNGNSAVKNLVSGGLCNLGFTDSDDFFVAKDAGKPVAMLPVRLENNKTICIPNTVAIIKGCKHKQAAQKLLDYLTSQKCEMLLANSRAGQIPLGENTKEENCPKRVQKLLQWAKNSEDLRQLLPIRKQCLQWLKNN